MKPVILTAIEGNPVKLTTSEAPIKSPGAPLDPERIPPDRGPGPPDGPSPLPRPGSPGSPIEANYPPGRYGGRRCPCHRRVLRRPNSGALSDSSESSRTAVSPPSEPRLAQALARRPPTAIRQQVPILVGTRITGRAVMGHRSAPAPCGRLASPLPCKGEGPTGTPPTSRGDNPGARP